jgi:hypothetical protein
MRSVRIAHTHESNDDDERGGISNHKQARETLAVRAPTFFMISFLVCKRGMAYW